MTIMHDYSEWSTTSSIPYVKEQEQSKKIAKLPKKVRLKNGKIIYLK